jgi:hypothetical protein
MCDLPISERILAALQIENNCRRSEALRELYDPSSPEMLQAVVSLLDHPEQAIRRRAGSALAFLKLRGAALEQKAETLADHLQHNPDEWVRLSCAVVLALVPGAPVDHAFTHALADPSERVVLLACVEVGERSGTAGIVALYEMLGHPSWQVRLQVCKVLIIQKKADARVVSTLEALIREPEAAAYDVTVDQTQEFVDHCVKTFCLDRTDEKLLGKLDAILTRAREISSGER